MAAVHSTMMPLGTGAVSFSLPDAVSKKTMGFSDCRGEKGTLVMFICNHCPFVIHIQPKLLELARRWQGDGIGVAAICSNDAVGYPDDSPEMMEKMAREKDFSFPYLHDETQEVAKAYQAACTPDFFLFDKDNRCVYRGRFDGATPGNEVPVTGQELDAAISALSRGEAVAREQLPSIGCNIKWKDG